MSENPRDGVVNKCGQSPRHPEPVRLGRQSQFTTGAAENPTLTIVALAIRQADHIAAEESRPGGFDRGGGAVTGGAERPAPVAGREGGIFGKMNDEGCGQEMPVDPDAPPGRGARRRRPQRWRTSR